MRRPIESARITLYWHPEGKLWSAVASLVGTPVALRRWESPTHGAPTVQDLQAFLRAMEAESESWLF